MKNCSTDRQWLSNTTPWGPKFVLIFWGIWRARNDLVFNTILKDPVEVVKVAEHHAREVGT